MNDADVGIGGLDEEGPRKAHMDPETLDVGCVVLGREEGQE